MKRILKSVLFVALTLASVEMVQARGATTTVQCMKARVPKEQIYQLDCYSDYDVPTRDGYECFIKFAPNKKIKRVLENDQIEEWVQQGMGKNMLSTYADKNGQPQILIFENAGKGKDKIDVEVLASRHKYTADEIAQAAGADEAVLHENNLSEFNKLKNALGARSKNCHPSKE